MSQRHPVQSGDLMLITLNTLDRTPVFQDPAKAREAIARLYRVQELHPFFLKGFVIMPDHCHFLVNVPEGESISRIMNSYKTGLCFDIGNGPIWQPRFHIRLIHNAYEALRYIHNNPMKAGLVEAPEKYPWSSASGKWDIVALDT